MEYLYEDTACLEKEEHVQVTQGWRRPCCSVDAVTGIGDSDPVGAGVRNPPWTIES
jgi:hypothetical protein